MIKNIVFDFGQVLAHFDYPTLMQPYLPDPDDQAVVGPVAFDRYYWDKLDAGTVTIEQVITDAQRRLPFRYHTAVSDILKNWMNHLPEMEGMQYLLNEIRRRTDVRLFVLSNICREFSENWQIIPILHNFDGLLFSADYGVVKPSPEIFRLLCSRFQLQPSETLFIDDNQKNIDGAVRFGIRAIQFNNVNRLKEQLPDFISELRKGS